VRDYETVKVEQEVPNEFLLVLHDGDSEHDNDDPFGESIKPPPREKAAYYKNIERKMLLKKKRQNVSPSFYLSASLPQTFSSY
jgi:RNA polymerase II-associated factor 1